MYYSMGKYRNAFLWVQQQVCPFDCAHTHTHALINALCPRVQTRSLTNMQRALFISICEHASEPRVGATAKLKLFVRARQNKRGANSARRRLMMKTAEMCGVSEFISGSVRYKGWGVMCIWEPQLVHSGCVISVCTGWSSRQRDGNVSTNTKRWRLEELQSFTGGGRASSDPDLIKTPGSVLFSLQSQTIFLFSSWCEDSPSTSHHLSLSLCRLMWVALDLNFQVQISVGEKKQKNKYDWMTNTCNVHTHAHQSTSFPSRHQAHIQHLGLNANEEWGQRGKLTSCKVSVRVIKCATISAQFMFGCQVMKKLLIGKTKRSENVFKTIISDREEPNSVLLSSPAALLHQHSNHIQLHWNQNKL